MKKIGFLSFGHWADQRGSATRSARDVLLQSIELAVEAEKLGADGAYFRVHHFADELSSPFPLLAAIGAVTHRIEIGTGVIDMRYEDPAHMVEDAGAADLIGGQRLQVGISRGSPDKAVEGWRHYGQSPAEGESDADMARRHSEAFLRLLEGDRFARAAVRPGAPGMTRLLRPEPHSEGLRDRIWWGAASDATAAWAGGLGMHLMSSTLKADESGEPLHVQQARQIRAHRIAWRAAGRDGEPRASVSRAVFPLVTPLDRLYFGESDSRDQVGMMHDMRAVFGRTFAAIPEELVELLREDEAVAEADTLLLTIPNQLGVAYNAQLIENVLRLIAPELGWR